MKKLAAVFTATLLVLAIAAPVLAEAEEKAKAMNNLGETSVDVTADGVAVAENVAPGETADLTSLAGTTVGALSVTEAGTANEIVAASNVAIPASGNFTLSVQVDEAGAGAVQSFENNIATTAAGHGRLVVRHTAALGCLDILSDGVVLFSDLTNTQTVQADLAAGTYALEAIPCAGGDAILGTSAVVKDGEALILYAAGTVEGENLVVHSESITGLEETPVAIQSGNSPVDDGFPTVAVAAVVVIATLAAAGGLAVARHRS